MPTSRHALIGVLLLACTLAHSGFAAAQSADDGWTRPDTATATARFAPPVGTWKLAGESSSRRKLVGTLVILSNDDARLEGYIRWKSPGALSTIEVFRGTCDLSRGVTLEGFEVLSQRTNVGIGRHRATYDVETRELKNGISMPLMAGGVSGRWTATYADDPPSTLPKMMNLPSSDGRWPMLCRNLSEGFARGRIGHWHFSNASDLAELLDANDERLTTLATLRQSQQALDRFVNSSLTQLSDADASQVNEAIEILKSLYPPEDGGATDLADPIQQLICGTPSSRARATATDDKLKMRALEGLVSSALRAQLIETAAPMRRRSEMRESDIRARCRPATEGGLVARVTNKSGRDLKRCLIVTQFSVDPQAVELASKDPAEQKLARTTIDSLLRTKGRTGRPNAQPMEYYWAYESLDKGSICYLETWPNGRTIDVDLAPAPCHCIEGTTARVYVFSSDGSMTFTIDKPSLQTAFAESRLKSKSSVAAKPKSKTKRSRPRAPS